MSAVVLGIVDGEQGEKDVKGWKRVQRVATVTGVTGTGNQRIALACAVSGVPQPGDAHPYLSDLVCISQSVKAHGKSNTVFAVTYDERAESPVALKERR